MGENVVGAIPAFTQHLSEVAAQGLPPDSPATSDSVYFDLCGLWMISYKASAAKWIHNALLPLLLLAPPPGVQRGAMAKAAGTCMLSLLSCLALPAAVGGLRAFLSGKISISADPLIKSGRMSASVTAVSIIQSLYDHCKLFLTSSQPSNLPAAPLQT